MISINITYTDQYDHKDSDNNTSFFILEGEYKVSSFVREMWCITNLLEQYGYTNWCMLGQFIFIRIKHKDYFDMIADDDFQDINFIEVIPNYPMDPCVGSLTATFTPLYT
tara:strand:- start:253 stop:582 length:330 start_codon:yes stop_codon:yes gene_type:complete